MKNKFSIFNLKFFYYLRQILGNEYPDSRSEVKKKKVVVEDNLRWQDDGGPEEEVKKQTEMKPFHLEGRANGEWCLIDFGDVIVHVFQREKREFYQLEDLWSDAVVKHYSE